MKAHREFELLVSRIEQILGGDGVVIKSPDRILDKFTGELREVDASIRCKVGSAEMLVTVECRDRVRNEDVNWIEQLATKQRHIGAAKTIAVSSTGFSQPALKAAELHGIATRRVEDVSDPEILSWVEKLQVEEINLHILDGRLKLVYEGEHPGAHLDVQSKQLWDASGFDAAIFIVDGNEAEKRTLTELVSKAVESQHDSLGQNSDSVKIVLPPLGSTRVFRSPFSTLLDDIPPDGNTHKRTFFLTMIDENISIRTNLGVLKLVRIGFDLSVTATRNLIPPKRIVSYSGNEKAKLYLAEREMGWGEGDDRIIVTQHRNATEPLDKKD